MFRLPVSPQHPERVCWGCEKFCRTGDLACGNGSIRTPHPLELFGEGWPTWAAERGITVDPDPKADVSATD